MGKGVPMKRNWVSVSVAGAALATGGAVLGATARRGIGPRNADATVPYGHGARIDEITTIARPPADVYAAFRDLESLPLVMPNIKRIESAEGSTHSRWTVAAPGGAEATWDAEIIEDVPGERIAWRADGAPVRHAGTVRFSPAPGGRGTEMRVEIEYVPPGGPLGAFAAKLVKGPPLEFVRLDLRRFKATIEAGDVAVNGTDVMQ